ncbi:LacI family DNA-binding transcriptional regulator [Actinomyces slackii]|uniref:Catabolite control protein n=1 Tax=Actinomyces slackii TaxID=52774 RepID=A0A3S5EM62_9ACTO|nr:LacI family DNA-binding transcriptional regulator [Actinomyces slackii]VEG74480.1 Catabolite control protein [Actinomyces slackii]
MGTHAATQSDVARAAGVSRSLVSLALSGSPKVARQTRERIQQVAAELGYRVNVAASSLARQSSTIIGLVLPNLRNAFFERLARCLGEAAAARGLTLFVTVGAEQPEVLHQAIESLLGVRVAGIILVSPWLIDDDLLAIAEETPVCLVGRRSPGGRVDAVHVDEEAAAGLVVRHLQEQGAQTIGYVSPRVTDQASRHDREVALRRAGTEAGVPVVVQGCGEDAGPAVRQMLQVRPEPLGLVIHNDVFAIDAVPVLREAERQTRSRVALVSYDNTYLAQREEFSLTSVNQPEEIMAGRAIELLCERAGIGGPAAPDAPARTVVLPPELVVRSSSLGREPLTAPATPPTPAPR